MISIPSVIVATIIFLSINDNSNNKQTQKTIELHAPISTSHNQKIEETDKSLIQKNTTNTTQNDSNKNRSNLNPKIKLESTQESVTQQDLSETSKVQHQKSNLKDKQQHTESPTSSNDSQLHSPISVLNQKNHITALEARRLKKQLYKNLIKDGIISSKNTAIEMALKEKSILVNGKELDSNLFRKYADLTHHVGSGKNRKIIMNSESIRVGDFTEKGFKGIGVGKFREEFIDNDEELFDEPHSGGLFDKRNDAEDTDESLFEERKELIARERKSLNQFIDSLYLQQDRTYKKSFYSGNRISNADLKEIHHQLYQFSIEDDLIKSKKEFLVLELNQIQLLLNLKEIESDKLKKYENFLNKYDIKRKTNRMIKISENTIAIGDYQPGSFTGTFMDLNE